MRRSAALAIGFLLLAAGAVGVAQGASRDLHVTVMHIVNSISKDGGLTGPDRPPAGYSLGDTLAGKGKLTPPGRSKAIGSVTMSCVVFDEQAFRDFCRIVHKLAGGTFTAEGAIFDGPPNNGWLAITGGTGAYKGVKGSVRYENGDQMDSPETVYLIR